MATCSISRALGAAAALVLLLPATAGAHVARYTNPAATATSGDCSLAFPCQLDYAIEGASDGDNVVVAPGTYTLQNPITVPQIDVAGESGPRPVIVGSGTQTSEMLSFRSGGTLRHLTLQGTAAGQDTLVQEGGVAEDLEIDAAAGDGVKVVGAPGTTILRDSVVRTADAASTAVRLGNPGGGDIALRNVTAIAPQSTAVRCDVGGGSQATLVDVIARGAAADVDATIGTPACTASYSNLRADHSPGLVLGDGIQAADPLFADATNGDFRPLAGSPTIDAGIADQFTGTTDPDGTARGTTPDIGAYEWSATAPTATPTPTPTPTPSDDTEGDDHEKKDKGEKKTPKPKLGSSVVVAPGQGKVLVRRPGNAHFEPVADDVQLPVGTVVDARLGRIHLTTALDTGEVQTGTFWGSRFQIVQSATGNGMTSLKLRGGSFARCPRKSSALAKVSTVAREYPARKVVRSLWARDRGGRFRTYGNNSVATARGTAWVTRDRCDGTLTRVVEGSVAVRHRGRTVIVRAGHRYLARR